MEEGGGGLREQRGKHSRQGSGQVMVVRKTMAIKKVMVVINTGDDDGGD